MNKRFSRPASSLLVGGAAFLLAGVLVAGLTPAAGAPAPPATKSAPLPTLAAARERVRMMDDIYVTAVLVTHKMYVRDPGTPAAVTWAKQVFHGLQGKGWPEARILSGVDRPLNPENDPSDPFERDAVAAFRAGKPSFERVEGGVLRYATALHVVDASCITCHVRAKPGDLLGGVSYRARFALQAK